MLYSDVKPGMRLLCIDTGAWTCIEAGKVYVTIKTNEGPCISCKYGVHNLVVHKTANGHLLQFDRTGT